MGDLLEFELDEKYVREYGRVISELVSWATELMGESEVESRLAPQAQDDGLESMIRLNGVDLETLRQGYSALAKVFHRLSVGESAGFGNELRAQAIASCGNHGLPVPPIGLGTESRDTEAG